MNVAAVAELAMGHIINADRRIADNTIAMRDGLLRKRPRTVGLGQKPGGLGMWRDRERAHRKGAGLRTEGHSLRPLFDSGAGGATARVVWTA